MASRTLFLYKNPAGQTGILARTMRQLGHEAASISFVPERFAEGGNPCDFYFGFDSQSRIMNKLYRIGLFFSLPWGHYDRLHFQGGQSLLPLEMDLPLYRQTGRRVYFTLHGSEVRSPHDPGDSQELPHLIATSQQRRTARRLCRWATGIVVTTPDLLEFVPGARYIPAAVDLERLPVASSGTSTGRVVRVVHAPTRRNLKGTGYVIDAVQRLRDRNVPIELSIVEGQPRLEAIELYRTADIIVDQLLIGWYGMFAVEAMAVGKPVVAYIRDELREYAPDLPVVSATPATIEARLEDLVCDFSLRQRLGQAGRAFVERVHSPQEVTSQMLDFYASSGCC